jgi:hypothetical protein
VAASARAAARKEKRKARFIGEGSSLYPYARWRGKVPWKSIPTKIHPGSFAGLLSIAGLRDESLIQPSAIS